MENILNWLKGVFIIGGMLIIVLIIVLIPGCLLAYWFCDIDPNKTYSWYSGIWHGIFCIPNLVRGVFYSDVLYKANNYTSAYNFWWWFTLINISLSILFGGGIQRNRY